MRVKIVRTPVMDVLDHRSPDRLKSQYVSWKADTGQSFFHLAYPRARMRL